MSNKGGMAEITQMFLRNKPFVIIGRVLGNFGTVKEFKKYQKTKLFLIFKLKCLVRDKLVA